MVKRLFLLLILFYTMCNAKAQTYTWAFTDTTYANSKGADVILGVGSDLLISELNSSGADIFKIDSNKTIIWKTKIKGWMGVIPKIALDKLGNIYVTGACFSDTLFVNGMPEAYGGGMFLIKVNGQGAFQWLKKSIGDARGLAIGVDNTNNVYVGCSINSSVYFDTSYINNSSGIINGIVKYDSNGNLKWVRCGSPGRFKSFLSMRTDTAGNSYLAGSFSLQEYFGNISVSAYGNMAYEDIYLSKIDSSGNWLWAKHGGGISQDKATDMTLDSQGHIYVTGFIGSISAFFDNVTLNNSGGDDFFVAKYDSNGAVMWAFNGGGPGSQFGNEILVSETGSVFLGTNSKFITQFDSLGTELWWSNPSASNLSMIANGADIYITGSYVDSVTFGDEHFISGHSSVDQMFVTKLEFPLTSTSISKIAPNTNWKLYPNPSRGTFIINCMLLTKQDIEICVKNPLGQTLCLEKAKDISGVFNKQVNIGEVSPGIYFVELTQASRKETKKIVIE